MGACRCLTEGMGEAGNKPFVLEPDRAGGVVSLPSGRLSLACLCDGAPGCTVSLGLSFPSYKTGRARAATRGTWVEVDDFLPG